MEVLPIPIHALERAWSLVGEWVLSAVDIGGDEEEEHVLEALCQGRYQLWLILRGGLPLAGAVTQIERRGGRKVVMVRYAGGDDLDLWASAFDREVEDYAHATGCKAIELDIRRGLVPAVEKHGYREAHRRYRRELSDG